MTTKIILGAVAGLLALGAVGCGGNNDTTGTPDMAKASTGSMPDMATWQCVKTPTSDPDFLNGCAPSGVDTFTITPTFPTMAPNGKLPSLP